MDRYQFRLDPADPRQRALMAELDAAPPGKRNAIIVDKLLRDSAAPTLEDIRSVVVDAIRDAGLQPTIGQASPAAHGIPADVFDILGKI